MIGGTKANAQRMLQWTVIELEDTRAKHVKSERLKEVSEEPYPSPQAGIEVRDSVKLQATDDGQVEWIVEEPDRARRGIIN